MFNTVNAVTGLKREREKSEKRKSDGGEGGGELCVSLTQ